MLLTSLLLSSLALTPPPAPVPGCSHATLATRRADAPVPAFAYDPTSELTDVHHYHLDIELDPWAQTIEGSNTMTVESLENGLTFFRFRLANTFLISGLTIDGTNASWVRLDADTIEVTLGGTWNAGDMFDLVVAYDGSPAELGFGSFEFRFRNGHPEAWF